jgi:hypothetical protein
MKILTYSPSVEAYACVVGKGGSKSYYDLSADVVSCTVTRNMDAESTFELTLANRLHKYNGLFTPMDLMTILANKNGERTKLISGYMTSVTKFTLYESNFEIKGKDTLYRAKQLYFDPHLDGTYKLFANENSNNSTWAGYSGYLRKLLCTVGGWPDSQLMIGEMPGDMVGWAQKLYAAQQSDLADAESMIKDFYNILIQDGPKFATSYGTAGAAASDAGLVAGQTIDIPEPYGGGAFTFEFYGDSYTWPGGTTQAQVHDLWSASGSPFLNNLGALNGRYLIACTTTFGDVGDRVTFYLDDGTAIPCVMQDTKAQEVCAWDQHPANKWGHEDGQCVIEFSYVSRSAIGGYGDVRMIMPDWQGKRVVKATNFGSVL